MRALYSLLIASAGFAQSPARPQFEVASIRPSAPQEAQANVGLHVDGAQVRITFLNLKDYISMAYRLKPHQVIMPEAIGSERYDIAAKIPEGTPRDKILDMMQALLEDRFHLKSHRDTKEFPVYGLVIAKGGIKLKPSQLDADENPGAVEVKATGGRGGVNVNLGRGSYFTFADGKLEAKKIDMPQLVDLLTRFNDKPVVDMTGLTGTYDISLTFSPEDYQAMLIRSAIYAGVTLPPQALRALEGVSGDTLFAALQTVGLKLESRKAPLEVLVVDSVSKTPTEN